jgi:hypothetical protein
VTESDWATCADPQKMLAFLRDRGPSERKLRLFAVACCRRVEHLLSSRHCRKALTTAERYADGEVSGEKLGFAWADARRASQSAFRAAESSSTGSAMWAVSEACQVESGRLLVAADVAARYAAYANDLPQRATAQSEQADLLRDIFGHVFGRTPFAPSWRTETAVALARQMYESRDFLLMPILGDALADAGCPDGEVLEHCRGPGPHSRGCWVADLILGKS